MSAPSPAGYGWILQAENELLVNWMEDVPAPKNILKTVHCGCKKTKCSVKTCSCTNAELQCTDLCGCIDCCNNVDIVRKCALEMMILKMILMKKIKFNIL